MSSAIELPEEQQTKREVRSHRESNFDINPHLIKFIIQAPFFARISQQLRKRPVNDDGVFKTIAVSYNMKEDQFQLGFNPFFMETLTSYQTHWVLVHEFYHIILGHLTQRVLMPHNIANIAEDLAINSIIEYSHNTLSTPFVEEARRAGLEPLPGFALVPGRRPEFDPEKNKHLSKEEIDGINMVNDLIEKLPKMKSSEFYFDELMKLKKKSNSAAGVLDGKVVINIGGGCSTTGMTLDDHDPWQEIPEDVRDYIADKAKDVTGKAVANCKSYGDVPNEIMLEIIKSLERKIDWRSLLRQFVGSVIRASATSSMRRINRKYPYVHPGKKRRYTTRILIAIDESGSVGNETLATFFGELDSLTSLVTFDVVPFDCDLRPTDLMTVKKGSKPKLQRLRSGGTDFDAPTNFANAPENRGRWDALIIMTDGQAPQPGPTRVKRAWILGENDQLMFNNDANELVLNVTNKRVDGIWR